MNGPSHYREAERIMQWVAALGPAMKVEYGPQALAEAQIHATLANAAALIELRSAYDAVSDGIGTPFAVEWEKAVGERES